MQLHQLLIISLSLLNTFSATRLPVCVIGAGPSGITMARKLKANNIPVKIFESDSRVGGKAYTWRDETNYKVEMGAFFFVRRDDSINRAVQEAGLNLSWFNGSQVDVYNQNGSTKRLPKDSKQQTSQFIDAVDRYTKLRDSYKLTVGYLDAPAEARVSLAEWLKVKRLEALRSFFIPNVVIQGYGALDDIPAMYIIKAFDLRGLSSLEQFGYALWTVTEGLDVLWKTLSKELDVKLNHKVTYIKRSTEWWGDRSTKLYFEDWRIQPVSCSHVVLAFPPYFSKVSSILEGFDKYEAEVFSKIKVNHYATSAIEMGYQGDSGFVFNMLSKNNQYPHEPEGKGEASGFINQGKYYTAYSFKRGGHPEPASAQDSQEFQTKLKSLLKGINTKRSCTPKIRFSKSFAYFPHASPQGIQQGFFKKFDELQGYKNTFYVTSALSFETMSESIEMSEAVFRKKVLPSVKPNFTVIN